MAIDLKPFDNPFRNAATGWWPKAAAKQAPRDRGRGKFAPQGTAFRIFARYGWAWGGFDPGVPDYMHFLKVSYAGGENPLERPYVASSIQYVPGGAIEAGQPH